MFLTVKPLEHLPINKKQSQLHCFDFDGTISTCDSFLEFIKFYKGSLPLFLALALLTPLILAETLFPTIAGKSKQLMLSFFFKGYQRKRLIEMGDVFFKSFLRKKLKPNAVELIRKLADDPTNVVVIVSASIDFWMLPVASFLNVDLICTKTKFKDGVFTGSFDGKNCKGDNKVVRLKSEFDLYEYMVFAYGNSRGDREMLRAADKTYYRCF